MGGLRQIVRFVNSSLDKTERSSFYIWFFGLRTLSNDALKSDALLRQQVSKAIAATIKVVPIKLTLEVSRVGLKLVQPYLLVNQVRKVKTLLVKHSLPATSIVTCTLGYLPYQDFVAIVRTVHSDHQNEQYTTELLVVRCDSAETAFFLLTAIEKKILMPQGRQVLRGERSSLAPEDKTNRRRSVPTFQIPDRPPLSLRTRTMYRMLIAELKSKIRNRDAKSVLKNTNKQVAESHSAKELPLRRFGDSFRKNAPSNDKKTPSPREERSTSMAYGISTNGLHLAHDYRPPKKRAASTPNIPFHKKSP